MPDRTPFSYKKQLALLGIGAFFVFAPVWAPHIEQVWGRNLFATPDSMVLLGVTLLVSLLAVYLLPDFIVTRRSSSAIRPTPSVFRWFAVVCGLSSVVLLVYGLYLVNRHILHSFLSSADEHSCYFLAECLRRGKLFVDTPAHADFFKVVHVGMKGGKWFSVYPPGWPLLWALGLQFHMADWLNPVMSALAVFFFYLAGIRLFSRWSVVCGLILMCLNPFFMFTAASYFSHGTCLLCIGVFLYTFLRWHEAYERGEDPIGWATLCGFAVGYGLVTRPLTMFAIAGPFLLYHFWPCFRKNTSCSLGTPGAKWWQQFQFKLRRSDWAFWGIVAFFMLLMLVQNSVVTGKLLKTPLKYYQSWERLGFKRGHYTPIDAFFFLIARVFYLMDWFAPSVVGAYLVLIFNFLGLKRFPTSEAGSEKKVLRNLFRLGMVFIAAAYFFYYSWGGNQWGPRYWWEGMPFLCIAVADGIVNFWQAGSARLRKFLLMFVVMSLVTSGLIFTRQAEYVEVSSRQRRALYDLAEKTAHGPAIVFIHGFIGDRLVLAEEDSVRNSPFLDGRILYAHDLGPRNKELIAAYSGREYYRGAWERPQNKVVLKELRP